MILPDKSVSNDDVGIHLWSVGIVVGMCDGGVKDSSMYSLTAPLFESPPDRPVLPLPSSHVDSTPSGQ
jgi:hypothetical protein